MRFCALLRPWLKKYVDFRQGQYVFYSLKQRRARQACWASHSGVTPVNSLPSEDWIFKWQVVFKTNALFIKEYGLMGLHFKPVWATIPP